MTRRDRTTGLSTESRTDPSQNKRNFFRSLQTGQYAVIALTLVLLFFVIGFFVYRIYEKDNWGEKTILEVGDEAFSLRYYADRFFTMLKAIQVQAFLFCKNLYSLLWKMKH